MKKLRHFISINDLSGREILKVLSLAKKLKTELKKKGRRPREPLARGGRNKKPLDGRTMVMIFEKPSLRTRVSFEAGMTHLGGHAIYLAPRDIGLGKRETIEDTSRVLSRMADIIMARTFKHETVVELSKYASAPVINGLSDLEHPCQILADLLTIKEKKGKLKGVKLAFIGDGENNVTHSLAIAAGILGMDLRVAAPKGYWMLDSIFKMASKLTKETGGKVLQTNDPKVAVKGADVVYTDTWVSMGDEKGSKKRLKVFKNYQVTKKLMALAKKDAVFMHDMPAYRGKEVAGDVIDGPQSVIIDQAENRLHAQKALVCFLLGVKVVK